MPSPPAPIGIIGLGIMGSAIAGHLIEAGHRVVGFDVRVPRVRALRRAGGLAAADGSEVGRSSRIVITSLPSAEALAETADALAQTERRPQVVIETSTLPIDVKERARRRLRARRVELLDCPISGTGAQARNKDVVVYASGSRAAYRQVSHVLDGFTRAHYYVGPFGAGSKVKFVANLLVAIHNVATAEALVLAMKAGLDPGTVLRLVGEGAGSSRVLQLRGPDDGERRLPEGDDDARDVAEGHGDHRGVRPRPGCHDAAVLGHIAALFGGRQAQEPGGHRGGLHRARENGALSSMISPRAEKTRQRPISSSQLPNEVWELGW